MTTILTYPCRKTIDLLDPKPEDFEIRDIAWALSKECRFGNFIPEHYSVAEHCIHAAGVAAWGCWEYRSLSERILMQKIMLLHEGGETLWRDMPSPNKKALPEYKVHENRARSAVFRRFGISHEKEGRLYHIEKKIDRMLYDHENAVLRGSDTPTISGLKLHFYKPEDAYSAFLDMYHVLFGAPPYGS